MTDMVANDPIFIVGMARTGTTLIARILNNHHKIHILNETHLVRQMDKFLDDNIWDFQVDKYILRRLTNEFLTIQRKGYYNKDLYEEYGKKATQIIRRYHSSADRRVSTFLKILFEYEWNRKGKTWGGDQTPNHVFHIDTLVSLFPNSKFIHTFRDHRAVILSQRNKWRAAKKKNLPRHEILRTLVSYHPITQSILWKKSVVAAALAKEKYGGERFYDIRFEDLISHPQAVVKGLCQFLGITFSENMLSVNLSMSSNIIHHAKISGIRKDVADLWKVKLSNTEIFIADLICSREAEKLGYKRANVTPDILSLLGMVISFPLHLALAVAFNFERIKNPIAYAKKLKAIKS